MQSHWSQSDVTDDGARLHYYRTNDGAPTGKPALVLAHGFTDNGQCWEEAAVSLETRYDVVMPDARGHGLSARVHRGVTIDMIATLAGFIRALGLQQPVVGGHSMGAGIASQLGARYPELTRALILEDPPWRMPIADGAAPDRMMTEDSPIAQWLARVRSMPLDALITECKAEHPAWSDTTVRQWATGKQQLDPLYLTTHNNAIGDWREVVRAIACPTLLVTADPALGGIVTPELAQRVTETNAHIRVAHVAGAGHHIRFADPVAYMGVVNAFLKEIGD